jgi:hypothetical protein
MTSSTVAHIRIALRGNSNLNYSGPVDGTLRAAFPLIRFFLSLQMVLRLYAGNLIQAVMHPSQSHLHRP